MDIFLWNMGSYRRYWIPNPSNVFPYVPLHNIYPEAGTQQAEYSFPWKLMAPLPTGFLGASYSFPSE